MSLLAILTFWVVAIWGLWSPRPVGLLLVFATLPLGSFAAIPPDLSGGFTITASSAALAMLCARQLLIRRTGVDEIARLALSTAPGRLLLSFWSVSVTVTLFAPRYFAGEVIVIPMANAVDGPSPLQPSSQNFSQLFYLTASCLAVLVFAELFRNPANRLLLLRGVKLSAAVLIATGVLDALQLDVVLEPFRTAGYEILNHQVLPGGISRVVGLMPEPATLGAVAVALLGLLYFLRYLPEAKADARQIRWLMSGLVLMVLLSTSSASLAAFGVLAVVVSYDWILRVAGAVRLPSIRVGTTKQLLVAISVLCGLLALAIVRPSAYDPVVEFVDLLLFAKTESSSFEERSLWTEVSFDAALATNGLGVGLGSTRASNYAVVLLASTGVAGAVLYAAFVGSLVLRRPRSGLPAAVVTARAMVWSLPPVLVVDFLVGTTPDFGPLHALRWGVLLSLAYPVASPRFDVGRLVDRPVPALTAGLTPVGSIRNTGA